MTPIPFVTDLEVTYGEADRLSPRIRRVVADNPGKFTFKGTGTYLVGDDPVAVVDPGPDDEAHVAAVLDAVGDAAVSHILVTHTHRDHSPASRALSAATGAAVHGYGPHPVADVRPEPAADDGERDEEPGDLAFAPDVVVRHGDRIAGDGFTFECLHTPGHISNHVCYALVEERALFPGDHVMGWSTTIVPPPDGNMGDYLASLALLLDRDDDTYYPTHGPPIPDPRPYVVALIAHRHERERQILDQLGSGGTQTIPAMVGVLYADVREELHEAAGRSVLAHLVHLADQGRVVARRQGDEELWSLA